MDIYLALFCTAVEIGTAVRRQRRPELFAGVDLTVVVGGKALVHDKLLFTGGDWLLAEIRDWIVLVIGLEI